MYIYILGSIITTTFIPFAEKLLCGSEFYSSNVVWAVFLLDLRKLRQTLVFLFILILEFISKKANSIFISG